MAIAPEQIGIGIGRYFTRPGTHPYDMVEWERREARITNYKDGSDAFFQPDVEFPTTWSQNATNIVAQKYFRGTLGTPERETSLKQVIDRIADTITAWGVRDGYFVDDQEGAAFRNELKYILLSQRAAFNSPVWFNIGVKGERQQASACQPYGALVSTVDGLVPIGELVEKRSVGTKVFDAHGLTKIVAVKANGRKEVLRVHTKAGLTLDVTPDHLVWRCRRGEGTGFVEAGTLRPGDQLEWHRIEHSDDPGASELEIARVESLGEMDVYDIQTESGEYLSNDLRVHNCFILAVDDTMDGILNWYREEGIIFKGGSGSGINLSSIRSSQEHLKGGGTASGPVSFMRGADASAGTIKCLDAETPIVTDRGVVPIREVRPGDDVLTRAGYERVEAVHDNGVRSLVRVRTALGDELLCTPEHRFRVRSARGEEWREAKDLRHDDHVIIDLSSGQAGQPRLLSPVHGGHHNEVAHELPHVLDEALALWLGWLYGDGSITTGSHAKFVAMQIGDEDPELRRRYEMLTRSVFGPSIHLFTNRSPGRSDASCSLRFLSSKVIRFLERNGLRKGKSADLRVPEAIVSSPAAVRAAFLAGLFEADGHVTSGYPHVSSVSAELALDVHRLLLSIGIPSRVHTIDDRRAALGARPVHVVRVVGGEGVRRFAKLVGFVSDRKSAALDAAVARKDASRFESQWHLPNVVEELRSVWTQTTDQALRRALSPYCKIASPRRMSLLRARALLDRFPDALGSTSLAQFAEGRDFYTTATVEPAGEGPTFDLTVANVHQYLVNSVVTHNSGGKTRRAAKMVILNADHPDVEEFIWCKATEERKARALRDAGFDMDLDGRDSHSIQYQNANNSVRVTDEFMQAVLDDADWALTSVTTGETIKAVKARELMRQINQAAWECADPGMQFDTTINRWHTAPNTGRINGSNPCCFVGETLVATDGGWVAFDLLEKMAAAGEPLPLVRAFDLSSARHVLRPVRRVWIAGCTAEVVDVHTELGLTLRCTPEHRFLLVDGTYIEARALSEGMALRSVDRQGHEALDVVASVDAIALDEQVPVYDLEVEGTHNFGVSSDRQLVDHAVIVHNSEYMHIDNSACNLASINLLHYLDQDDNLDVEAFKHTVEVVFTAQEILVGNADYPTDKIADNSRKFRQLGLGYANLGALLMARGMPYDSDDGRAWAGAITALMTGHAYATSARTAGRMGPFAGFADNSEATLNVLRMHRAEAAKIDEELVPPELLSAAQRSWDEAVELGERFGVRNSQASVLAPTGCLVGGTLVPTERGLVRLDSLGDPTGEQWQPLGIDVQTDAGSRRATQFYVNGVEPVVDVQTMRGYRVRGTARHRIKVVDENGAWVWRHLSDLRAGDRVPLALDQLVGEPQDVVLPPLAEAHWTRDIYVRVPRSLTPELAELVGYFMGDGSLHAKGLRFCVSIEDIDVVDHLLVLGKELFGLEAAVSWKHGYAEVAFHSVRLAMWWEACGFAKHVPHEGHSGKGYVPHVPDALLYANDRAVYAAFLRGLFEADGSVIARIPTWVTAKASFADEVQSLLLALGYPTARKHDVSGKGSQLTSLRLLNTSYHTRWLDEIGFIGARKSAKVICSEGRQAARQDHIPVTRELVDRLAPVNDRLRRVLLMEVERGRVSRRAASELYERTHAAELGHLLDFFYDTVASVDFGEEEFTYDLSVPDNVTYVANGFVSHNTIGLMMDCDTTGVEPDLALTKAKKLVGGGTMFIVNQTIPRALRRLGYTDEQVDTIVGYIDEHKTIIGAPEFNPEHLPVFACSMGDNVIHYMGHVTMMGAVQPFISGAISKCVVGETLLTTGEGLVRIASLHRGEAADSFRDEVIEVGSLGGEQKTDAFYYGGLRPVREAVLRSGHRIVGTPNHRVLVAGGGQLEWMALEDLLPDEWVAVQYGAELWSTVPARFDDFVPGTTYGCQKLVNIPEEMTSELAFLLGAYVAEGHTSRSNYTIRITNSVDGVLERVAAAWRSEFGVAAKVVRPINRCPYVVVASKTAVEFLDYLGCGSRASVKRIPDAVLRSPREVALAFLQGLALDAYTTVSTAPKWAICVDSHGLLDDLQAILTNLGIVHGRVEKFNKEYDKKYGEVYATGEHAQRLLRLVPFVEPDKAARAKELAALDFSRGHNTADVVPGITPRELYELIPKAPPGRPGRGLGRTAEFAYLCDPRTRHVSRRSLERVAAVPGVVLPEWLQLAIRDNLHFSPVESVAAAGSREVFDVSVPVTHAFVGNGILNHNTVNMPEDVTVEDVEQLHIDAWKLGIKAVAIYRDNCKVAQPLATQKKAGADEDVKGELADQVERIVEHVIVQEPVRQKLPRTRNSKTFSFRVADCRGFATVAEYEDGRPGELFLNVSKQGSTLAGIMDSFAISVSHGLQYGVPLRAFIETFTNRRFEPAGMTDDPDIRIATSLVDYIFRKLAVEYLSYEERSEIGVLTTGERTQPTLPGVEEAATTNEPMRDELPLADQRPSAAMTPPGPGAVSGGGTHEVVLCHVCGDIMQRAGSCHACPSCGATSGCS